MLSMTMERLRGTIVETSQESTAAVEVFKALGDPVRWSIIAQIAAVDELPCADLEQTLTVSKPTISYHTKILQQAGLLSVRKEGRNYFYALRRDVLREVQDELWRLAPAPRPVGESGIDYEVPAARHRSERPAAAQARNARRDRRARRVAGDDDVVLLTW
ncbi:MAG: putative ArsR family transcriptional regulator [Solirubrobacterales bacterium]|nr:putative ArsR family transcriptional regulator [Solirubrobacterales bacterium]